jgi:hypothetical protein
MSYILSMDEINILDKQIELLMDYKPVPEHEVKALCEKVPLSTRFYQITYRPKKSWQRRAMCSLSGVP